MFWQIALAATMAKTQQNGQKARVKGITTPTQKAGTALTRDFTAQRTNFENPNTGVPLPAFAAFFHQPTKLVYPTNAGDFTHVPMPTNTSLQKPAYNKIRTARPAPNTYVFQDNSLRPSSPGISETKAPASGLDALFGWHRADASIARVRSVQRPGQQSPAQAPVFDKTTVGGLSYAGATKNPVVPATPYTPGAGVAPGGLEENNP